MNDPLIGVLCHCIILLHLYLSIVHHCSRSLRKNLAQQFIHHRFRLPTAEHNTVITASDCSQVSSNTVITASDCSQLSSNTVITASDCYSWAATRSSQHLTAHSWATTRSSQHPTAHSWATTRSSQHSTAHSWAATRSSPMVECRQRQIYPLAKSLRSFIYALTIYSISPSNHLTIYSISASHHLQHILGMIHLGPSNVRDQWCEVSVGPPTDEILI